MAIFKVEQIRDDFIALRPVYGENGDATEVILENGEIHIDRRGMRSVVRAAARAYAIDITAQRDILKKELKRGSVMPFYLGKQRVFVPVKMRQAVTENDATYGYVDVRCIEQISELGKRNCRVVLGNGIQINAISNQSTIIQSQHQGYHLLDMFAAAGDEPVQEEIGVEAARWTARMLVKISAQLDRIENRK